MGMLQFYETNNFGQGLLQLFNAVGDDELAVLIDAGHGDAVVIPASFAVPVDDVNRMKVELRRSVTMRKTRKKPTPPPKKKNEKPCD